MAIRTVIVDDEKPSREELKFLLKKFPEFEISGEFDNAFDALSFLIASPPDLVFFDINMPGFNGLSLAEVLKGTENHPLIVFITAYSDYAVKAFDVDAIDYLLKPIDGARFAKTITKVRDKFKESSKPKLKFIMCEFQRELVLFKPEDVNYFYAEKGKLYAKKGREAFLVKGMKLQEVEEKFVKDNFLRINKEYVVNLNKVAKLIPLFKGRYVVQMDNGDKLALSPHHQKEFRGRFNY